MAPIQAFEVAGNFRGGHRPRAEWHEVKGLDNDFRWDSEAPPTTELASVEECSQPECGTGRPLATMRLVRVERCFQSVFPGTSLHGGELRGGVATSLGGVLVANIARRGQAPPWRKITPEILNLAPFGPVPVESGLATRRRPFPSAHVPTKPATSHRPWRYRAARWCRAEIHSFLTTRETHELRRRHAGSRGHLTDRSSQASAGSGAAHRARYASSQMASSSTCDAGKCSIAVSTSEMVLMAKVQRRIPRSPSRFGEKDRDNGRVASERPSIAFRQVALVLVVRRSCCE